MKPIFILFPRKNLRQELHSYSRQKAERHIHSFSNQTSETDFHSFFKGKTKRWDEFSFSFQEKMWGRNLILIPGKKQKRIFILFQAKHGNKFSFFFHWEKMWAGFPSFPKKKYEMELHKICLTIFLGKQMKIRLNFFRTNKIRNLSHLFFFEIDWDYVHVFFWKKNEYQSRRFT